LTEHHPNFFAESSLAAAAAGMALNSEDGEEEEGEEGEGKKSKKKSKRGGQGPKKASSKGQGDPDKAKVLVTFSNKGKKWVTHLAGIEAMPLKVKPYGDTVW
jgi:hypothetical protein